MWAVFLCVVCCVLCVVCCVVYVVCCVFCVVCCVLCVLWCVVCVVCFRFEEGQSVHVSHIKLALHFGIGTILYGVVVVMLW